MNKEKQRSPEQSEQEGLIPTAGIAGKKLQSAETGGPKGPEPTRYGDWEIGGKCVDF